MNQLWQTIRIALAWISSRSWSTKLTIYASVILLASLAVWQYQASNHDEFISLLDQHELKPNEITSLQIAFGEDGLNNYRIENSQVLVPAKQRDVYLKSLAKNNVLKLADDIDKSFSPSLFLTSQQESKMEIERKKSRLRNILMQLPSIEEAWVEYDEARKEPFRPLIRKAAITFRTLNGVRLSHQAIKTILAQTRGTFPGLADQDIEIIDLSNGLTITDNSNYSEEKGEAVLSARKQELQSKINSALRGFEQVDVLVHVEPRPHLETPTENTTPFQFASRNLSGNDSTGSPWVGSNGQVSLADISSPHANDRVTTQLAAAQLLTTVHVNIGVPETYVRQIIHRRNPGGRTITWKDVQSCFGDLRVEIEQLVRPLLPESQADHVTVVLKPAGASDIPPSPTAGSRFRDWFESNWKVVVLVVFGICALLILRPNKTVEEEQST